MRRIIVDIKSDTEDKENQAVQGLMIDIMTFAKESDCQIERIENVAFASGGVLLPSVNKAKMDMENRKREAVFSV